MPLKLKRMLLLKIMKKAANEAAQINRTIDNKRTPFCFIAL